MEPVARLTGNNLCSWERAKEEDPLRSRRGLRAGVAINTSGRQLVHAGRAAKSSFQYFEVRMYEVNVCREKPLAT
jgi:hypothetical protein